MTIHKEGYTSIVVAALLLLGLGYIANQFLNANELIEYTLYGIGVVIFFLVVRFFRVPKRIINKDDNAILCAADGKVVAIEEVFEDEFLNKKCIQVSVFMSPLNVHVNWYPISGTVRYAKHHPGKHYPAFLPKSSTDNERSSIALEHKNGKSILMRQIAGSLARRIVFYSKENQEVNQFDEFGIIKFGSRVDLFLPTDAKINVSLEQKVTAGKDIIAYFK